MAREVNPKAKPEDDEMIPEGVSVIQAINACRHESEMARRDREVQGDKNWQLYLGKQDYSHKQEGQSQEFLPKVPVAVEQMSALVKRALVQFGNYFSVDVDTELGQLITGDEIREMLKVFLRDLWAPGGKVTDFPTIVSDAMKQALLKCLIIFKVHGAYKKGRKLSFEKGIGFKEKEIETWKLRIDLVRFEDYYPDPTGNNLYEIHRVERDLYEVVDMSEGDDPIYDPAMVQKLVEHSGGGERADDEKLSEGDRNQNETTPPSFRKRVVLDEFWGTLLRDDGTVAHRNIVATVANERFLIRPPEPNPFWHQRSPLVVAPLIRVPHSVWHKALYDHASDLNIAINELYNLLIDGGMASVWGISQLRVEDLEDPSQVEGGIRQGMTLAVKQTLPHNAKVYERLTEGQAPIEALQIFESLNSEFSQAALTNELKLGSLPQKQVLATEVLESGQSQNLMLDGVVADLENQCMSPTLELAFLVIMQMADKLPEEAFSFLNNKKVALMIMRAEPEERFVLFFNRCRFVVNGLSSTMARALEFQKLMAFLQAVGINPLMLQAFITKYSPEKFLAQLLNALNLNPKNFERTEEELRQLLGQQSGQPGAGTPPGPGAEVPGVGAMSQVLGGGPQNSEGQPAGVAGGPGTGGDPTTAGIQRAAQPASQMPGNA